MALLSALLIACGDQAAPELDAGVTDASPPDGGACVEWPAFVREAECKQLCVPANVCPGSESAGCLFECAGYGRGTHYCPVL